VLLLLASDIQQQKHKNGVNMNIITLISAATAEATTEAAAEAAAGSLITFTDPNDDGNIVITLGS